MIALRPLVAAAAVLALAGCTSPPAAGPGSSSASPSGSSAEGTTTSPSSSDEETATSTTSATGADPGSGSGSGSGLPNDLTPNVIEDECLLTGAEFSALTGQPSIRAENTQFAGDASRRSCFYAPESADDPAGRVDVYATTSATPSELVARIASNVAGSRTLPGVGTGAVVLQASGGTFELVVASASLLAVLTLLPAGAATPPADDAWTTAGTAIASRMPR